MILFAYFIVYFLVVFVVRSVLVWKRTGINPMTINRTDDAQGYNGWVYKMISGMELLVVGIYAFSTEWYQYLLPFWYLECPVLRTIGWVLLVLSLIFVWIAQSQMANSWRIGIDEKNKSELVDHGLFSISRNPIFLGIMMANIGLFLVIPNAFTLLICALSTVSMNTQIRLEENFLKQEFGSAYESYIKKVRRWI